MARRSPAKISLRNKIFDMLFGSYVNGCEVVTLEEIFYTLRTMPAIIDKNKHDACALIKHEASVVCQELMKCGVLVTKGYNRKHHHEVNSYKPFVKTKDDMIRLRVEQRRRVNRVKATEYITMEQIKLAMEAGMSLEEYKGSCIEEGSKVTMIPEFVGDSQ